MGKNKRINGRKGKKNEEDVLKLLSNNWAALSAAVGFFTAAQEASETSVAPFAKHSELLCAAARSGVLILFL